MVKMYSIICIIIQRHCKEKKISKEKSQMKKLHSSLKLIPCQKKYFKIRNKTIYRFQDKNPEIDKTVEIKAHHF